MDTFFTLSEQEQTAAVQKSIILLLPEDREAHGHGSATSKDPIPVLAYQSAATFLAASESVQDAIARAVLVRVPGPEQFSAITVVQRQAVLAVLVNTDAPHNAFDMVVDADAVVAWAEDIARGRSFDKMHQVAVFMATLGSVGVVFTKLVKCLRA